MQVQDAFKSQADATIERLTELLKKENISYGAIDRNDPKTIEEADSIQITINGVPSEKAGDFRRIVNDAFGQTWLLSSEGRTTA